MEVASLTIPIRADLSPLETALANVPGLLANAGQRASGMADLLARAGNAGAESMQRYAAQIDTVQQATVKLNSTAVRDLVKESDISALASVKGGIEGVASADVAAAASQKAQAAEVSAAKKTVSAAIREIEKAEDALGGASRRAADLQVQSAERVQKAQQQANQRAESARQNAMSHLGTAAGQIGAMATHGGTVILSDLAEAVKVTGEYQESLNILQATSHASNEEMKRADDLAIKLGADQHLPATSAKTAADAMLAMSQAGLGLNDVMAAARPTLQLAAAGHLDAAKAATISARALNTFGIAGSDAGKAIDVLASLVPAAGSKIEQTAEAVKRGGGAAHQAGIDIHDFGTEVGLMARQGISGGAAGTQLAAMLKSLQSPSAAARGEMQHLGFSIFDASGHMKSQREVIEQLGGKLNGLNEMERIQAVNLLFSSAGRRAANVVILGGLSAYDEMAAKVGKAGSAQELADARMRGYVGSVENFRSQIETLQITLGKQLIPSVTSGVQAISGLVDGFNHLGDPAQGAIAISAGALGTFLVVGGGILSITNTVMGLANAWKATAVWIAAARAAQGLSGGAAGAEAAASAALTTGAGGAAGGGLFAGAGQLLAGVGGLAAGGVGAAVGVASEVVTAPVAALGMMTASQRAGQGSDINQNQQAVNDQTIHYASQLQRTRESLEAFERMTTEQRQQMVNAQFGVTVWGANAKEAADYEKELRAMAEAARTRISALQSGFGNSIAGGLFSAVAAAFPAEISQSKQAARHHEDNAYQNDLAEEEKATKLLRQEKERLNAAIEGGKSAEQAFAGRISGLTAAHKAEALALFNKIQAINQAQKAREKQAQTDERFKTLIAETENRLRAANGTEIAGLETLKAAYPGVTEARLRSQLALDGQVKAAEKAAAEADQVRKRLEETEKRFATLKAETQNRIDAAQGKEISGLEKLKAAYPGIEEGQLRAELAHQKAAAAAEKQKDTTDKLEKSLSNLKSQTEDGTAKLGVHKIAVEVTGQAYEALTAKQRATVDQITAIKKAAADHKAFDDLQKKLQDAGLKMQELGQRSRQMADQIRDSMASIADARVGQGQLADRIQQRSDGNDEYFQADVQDAQQINSQLARTRDFDTRAQLGAQLRDLNPEAVAQANDLSAYNKADRGINATENKVAKLRNELKEVEIQTNSYREDFNHLSYIQDSALKGLDLVTEAIHKQAQALNQAAKAASGLAGQMSTSGKEAASGLSSGLESGTGQVRKSAGDVSKGLVDQVNKDLEIQSPSRVFAQIGTYVVDGMAIGIQNGTQTVAGAASGMVQTTVAQAMSAVPSTLSQKQAAFQQSISQDFAARVVAAAKQADLVANRGIGNPNDTMAAGYYAQLARDAQRYDSLVVGGKTISRSDSASQLSGAKAGHTYVTNVNMTVHTPDVAGFQMSRPQIMQQMYEDGQSASFRNG